VLRIVGVVWSGLSRYALAGQDFLGDWAEEHDIDDPQTFYSGPCLSNPEYESFSEGCEAYVDDSTGATRLDPDERYSGAGAGDGSDDN
jgi:hypothetical protein